MDYKIHRTYANMPLKQVSNRVWRTYEGGALIDRWKGTTPAVDNSFPEEWIMSTIIARGKDRPVNEGLSLVKTSTGLVPLRDLINADPTLFLGEKLAQRYGTTGVLIKMLDSKERLTIQVHPDKKFASENLGSEFGKTESWYVLGGREIDGEKSAVYMGFKEHVTPKLWKQYFRNQNIEGMLNCLHRIEIKPGDAFMVYGGVPHAIGAGCFLLEVQEPTDYTMRVERTTPQGLEIDDALIHQGVGIEKMLQCFHYDTCSYEEALERWQVTPEESERTEGAVLKEIINQQHTDCFGVSELVLDGSYTLSGNGSFFVAVIYEGTGAIEYEAGRINFKQGDEIFFSGVIEHATFASNTPSKILLCYPPVLG